MAGAGDEEMGKQTLDVAERGALFCVSQSSHTQS